MPVVQSWFSVRPGLKFKSTVLVCVYFNAFFLKLEKGKLQSIQSRFMKKNFMFANKLLENLL